VNVQEKLAVASHDVCVEVQENLAVAKNVNIPPPPPPPPPHPVHNHNDKKNTQNRKNGDSTRPLNSADTKNMDFAKKKQKHNKHEDMPWDIEMYPLVN